jgi:hypothetical protein
VRFPSVTRAGGEDEYVVPNSTKNLSYTFQKGFHKKPRYFQTYWRIRLWQFHFQIQPTFAGWKKLPAFL